MRVGEPAERTAAEGGCWPTPDQVLLLRAGLFPRDEAVAAWLRWREANAPEDADSASLRLFPLVYRNLLAAGLAEDDLTKLKGAYRATWFANQILVARLADALRRLADADVRTLVLKGAALALAHYRDVGVRPMDDVDVLVAPADVWRALAVLEAGGWTVGDAAASEPGAGSHARPLHDAHGRSLDLHWYSLAQSDADDAFWAASVELEVNGVPTRALAPSDALLHVAAHGARWNHIPPVRWMADAVAIERAAGPALDWDRVVAEAARRRVTVSVAAALEHLAEAVRFAIPPGVLERLHAAPKARFERWAHSASMRPAGGGTWLPVELDRYRRLSSLDASLRFGDFAKAHFAVTSYPQLGMRLGRKTVQVGLAQASRLVPPRLRRLSRG